MKFALTLLALGCLLLGCHKYGDAKIRSSLPGTWSFEQNFANGNKYESEIIVASNRDFVCHITMHGQSNLVWHYELTGSIQIKAGYWIETVTRHSDTNAKLPMISSFKIIRADEHELVLESKFMEQELPNGGERVFQKRTK